MLSFLRSSHGWPYLLVPFIPLAVVLELMHAGPIAIFTVSALGVIPTAALMGQATEHLAARSGPGIGGFLNVTFGNAPEIIIALFALNAGLHEVVKASLIGSILGNVLLVLGAAMFVGGLKRERQFFDRTAASAQSSMLLLAAAALAIQVALRRRSGKGEGVDMTKPTLFACSEFLNLRARETPPISPEEGPELANMLRLARSILPGNVVRTLVKRLKTEANLRRIVLLRIKLALSGLRDLFIRPFHKQSGNS